jgi:glycosyltransferase involved in cell wall biosynthesis
MNQITIDSIGVVIIGRNEGARLISCLNSLIKSVKNIVYVDSGSTDSSVSLAEKMGANTLLLDLSIPFSAARARNEGATYLLNTFPEIEYIQFVDGDCEIQPNWIECAHKFLDDHSDYAVVCGRRRERFPEKSIYNQLCDIEWNTAIGDVHTCGGDALIRASAYQQVDGYKDTLIAGEEPEMCFRMREKDWKIYRLDAEMTLHDAAMTKLSQWWNRAVRAGYAYAEGCYLHGRSAEKYKVKQTISILFWAMLLPVLIALISLYDSVFINLFVIYPLQVFRLTLKNKSRMSSDKKAFYYAMSNLFGKLPQFFGMMRFALNKWKGQRGTLIEYK